MVPKCILRFLELKERHARWSLFVSVERLIGNTPSLLLTPKKIMVKLEYFNPSGSVKDRPAWFMLKRAEEEGVLKRGDTVVEPSSGNTAISLAMLSASRGYKFVAVISKETSLEKIKMLRAFGAKIVFGDGGMDNYKKAKELAERNGWVMLDQYRNPANVEAHYKTTGPEIWEEARKLMGGLDCFVAGVGTGGTLMGVAKYLKEVGEVKAIAVIPRGAKILEAFGKKGYRRRHAIEGLAGEPVSKLIDPKLVDEIIEVDDKDAFETMKRLMREGLTPGISGGANVYASLISRCERVATVIPDSAWRYVSRF